jgi:hypothetical protein
VANVNGRSCLPCFDRISAMESIMGNAHHAMLVSRSSSMDDGRAAYVAAAVWAGGRTTGGGSVSEPETLPVLQQAIAPQAAN